MGKNEIISLSIVDKNKRKISESLFYWGQQNYQTSSSNPRFFKHKRNNYITYLYNEEWPFSLSFFLSFLLSFFLTFFLSFDHNLWLWNMSVLARITSVTSRDFYPWTESSMYYNHYPHQVTLTAEFADSLSRFVPIIRRSWQVLLTTCSRRADTTKSFLVDQHK